MALPAECSVSPSTTTTSGEAISSKPSAPFIGRPEMFGSIPAPLISLPICSTTRMSISFGMSRPIAPFASRSSSSSRWMQRSGGIASTIIVSS